MALFRAGLALALWSVVIVATPAAATEARDPSPGLPIWITAAVGGLAVLLLIALVVVLARRRTSRPPPAASHPVYPPAPQPEYPAHGSPQQPHVPRPRQPTAGFDPAYVAARQAPSALQRESGGDPERAGRILAEMALSLALEGADVERAFATLHSAAAGDEGAVAAASRQVSAWINLEPDNAERRHAHHFISGVAVAISAAASNRANGAQPLAAGPVCARCGSANSPGMVFCAACGISLARA